MNKFADSLARSTTRTVMDVPAATVQELAARADRNMQWQCIIQDGEVQLMGDTATVTIQPTLRMAPLAQGY